MGPVDAWKAAAQPCETLPSVATGHRRTGHLWAPTKANREAIRFWLDCLQIITVVAGVAALAGTFYFHSVEQDQHAREQLAAVKIDLERPYEEKKLALYLDAARVLAHLATTPDVDKAATEARFWELYWGELAFVESKDVETLMVKFCEQYFTQPGSCRSGYDNLPANAAALNLAREASKEIRDRWERIGQ
jgi:hypothetical protein